MTMWSQPFGDSGFTVIFPKGENGGGGRGECAIGCCVCVRQQKKAGSGVKCTFRGCSFSAKNEKGLKSHWSQKHIGVEESSDDDEDGDEETDDEDEDSDDTGEDAMPTRSSSSSCSSTTPTTKTTATTSSSSNRRCLHCQKDCTYASGLSSRLRHSPACKAAADRNK